LLAERSVITPFEIQQLPDQPAIVAIHDAARPNIQKVQIEDWMGQCQKVGSAIPFIGPADSVRMRSNESCEVIQRDDVMLIQTPQCFQLQDLKKAYDQEFQLLFTDDASVMESKGFQLHFVPGDKLNFKITHPSDWWMMQQIFKP
jgi:2-C-methyl-D-erythritol 4-phosphate cytidylyltransferase